MKEKFIEHFLNKRLTQEDVAYVMSLSKEEVSKLYREIERVEMLIYLKKELKGLTV